MHLQLHKEQFDNLQSQCSGNGSPEQQRGIGEVVLVEAVPEAFREVTRFRAFDGKTWNPPALAGEYLLVRTDAVAACYRLPVDGG